MRMHLFLDKQRFFISTSVTRNRIPHCRLGITSANNKPLFFQELQTVGQSPAAYIQIVEHL